MFIDGIVQWWIPLLLFSIVLVCFPIMKRILGPEAIRGSAWEEEGFENMRTWLAESHSTIAKLTRFNFIFGAIVFVGSLIFGIVIYLIRQ